MALQQQAEQLQQEIDSKRQEIRSDGYSMSIGEWISLYEDGEIDIHPEFQRFFRWSSYQKTSLIESLLLGIPIPPIFVSQREDGIWDVVDGLQRLSTIYEFAGKLKDETDKIKPALALEKTKYLPSLKGKKWDDESDPENSFTQVQRLLIKRSKIAVTILQKESDEMAKYELFQRLNTGGSTATSQEIRNCILVMYNKEMYHWMRELSQNEMFQACLSLSDRSLEEQYDMELLLRFLVFRTIDRSELRGIGDIGIFLTDKMVEMAQRKDYEYQKEAEAFKLTFDILFNQTGSNTFRKYVPQKDKFSGGFLVSAFEVIALGVGYNYKELCNSDIDIEERVKHIWTDTLYPSWSGSGTDAKGRMPKLVPLGRDLFKA
jgi:Protein of unknown function DUF262